MAIKLIHLKNKDKKYTAFSDKEWRLIHPEHYGQKYDEKYWDEKPLRIIAKQDKEIVGALRGMLIAGVLEVFQLIVGHEFRGEGIGRMLMEEAERWAKKNGAHEVFLTTGERWKAVEFYKQMGYQITTRLPNHYSKTDFVLFRKFLS